MKHRTRCFGAAVLAALVLAMLCVPALAAEIAVDYTSEYQFSAADFSDSSELEGVYISAVPPAYQAELCIGSRVLRRGDILPAAALEKLKLRPVCLGEADCELVYCPISAGTLGDAVTVSLRILSGTNTAPVCEDGTLETYKNIANSGTLCAQDKEDTKLTYQLVKEPKRGTVELHDDGSFTYTPGKNKVGKDSFVFTATDPAGNVSNEACVKIRILKPADKATYQDMSGDKDAFAAMWLKDQGLYTGRIIAGNLCFEPDDAVSRGEFLIACMKLAGARAGRRRHLDRLCRRAGDARVAAAVSGRGLPVRHDLGHADGGRARLPPGGYAQPCGGRRHAPEAPAAAGRRGGLCR